MTYFVDSMSSFGAVPINLEESHIDFLVSSANKCIEGVPGFAFALCRKKHLPTFKGKNIQDRSSKILSSISFKHLFAFCTGNHASCPPFLGISEGLSVSH